ncbi:MutS-related protein [Compostibacter hankyongensis]|uniref:MutS family DNA mismatch repair protein n=1 Tax=Compostibacter hankyongensis TaxID=1007089 RepID=A0ABP8G898_9BACT
MEIDKTTLEDLSVFNKEETYSVFHRLNFTRTVGGKEQLKFFFTHPLADIAAVSGTQDTVKYILAGIEQWPDSITNGTMMVMEKFFDAGSEPIPPAQNAALSPQNLYYRIMYAGDYSLVRYSLSHFISFFQGLSQLMGLYRQANTPPLLRKLFTQVEDMLAKPVIKEMSQYDPQERLSFSRVLYFGYQLRHQQRSVTALIALYYQLDAYYSMAAAVKHFGLSFPRFATDDHPFFRARALYHILLKHPVSYEVSMDPETNFLFLTGANMSGKSTFIKAIGISAFLAHIGMGVPAEELQLTWMDGLLSTIQVEDNVVLGESYFFNEVQRIKKTILKINDGRHWLILIDELFKGTNFRDAKICSVKVIEGLLKMRNSFFVLSTHLYEIAADLQQYHNIRFNYFETSVTDEVPSFSYQLKDGISNDRLGFLILKREKVLELLDRIG